MNFAKLLLINLLCIFFSSFCSEYSKYNPKWTRNDRITYLSIGAHNPIRIERKQEWTDLKNPTHYVLLAIALPYLPPFAAIQAEEISRPKNHFLGLSYLHAQYNPNLTNLTLEEVQAIDRNKRVLEVAHNAWRFKPTLEKIIEQYLEDQRNIRAEQIKIIKTQNKKPQSKL